MFIIRGALKRLSEPVLQRHFPPRCKDALTFALWTPVALRAHSETKAKTGSMRYWWVNQNQTFRHEIAGRYLWSPKRNTNLTRNPFYESMRGVSPGDLIFSFVDARIVAIGVAMSYCWECPKPAEFGTTRQYWENAGWRV